MIKNINKKIRKMLLVFFILAVFSGAVFYYLFFTLSIGERGMLVRNPFGYRILANWHSIRKIVNVIHLPYWFRQSELETYHITIKSNNLYELNNHKPLNDDGVSYGRMNDEDKHYVNAMFEAPGLEYSDEIKIRYRGTNNNNWDAEKNAYRIKFSKSNLFMGQRALNLFLPYDRAYFGEVLASYRAEKLGLFSAKFKFVRVYVNGRDMGVYLASEPWSKELLARSEMIDTNNVFSNKDVSLAGLKTNFSVDRLDSWKSYTAISEEGYFEELEALFRVMSIESDEEFADKISAILDLDSFYRWNLLNILQGSSHQTDLGNTVLLFKKETGKFQLVPWDVGLGDPLKFDFTKNLTLTKRIFGNEKLFSRFQEVVRDYVSNEENLADDLAFYDELYKDLKSEFYNDQAKLHNDIMFDSRVKRIRRNISGNFDNAKKISSLQVSPFEISTKEENEAGLLKMPGSFYLFNDVFKTAEEFVRDNKQFRKIDEKNIVLPRGRHVFYDKVIFPEGLKLKIDPGAEMAMKEGASFISYSPVVASGTRLLSIVVRAYNEKDRPWGTFAVVNTGKEKNIFRNIKVSGGSTEFLNGVFFTSQFSLHNALSTVEDSVFANGKSDDTFHAILGSTQIADCRFEDNFADGIDVDYVKSSKIINSVFANRETEDSNGDAIDVSGVSDMIISGNKVTNFGDKCLSIGEKSVLTIEDNEFKNCNIGVAVKDDSFVEINNSRIINNKEAGISLYRKKAEFVMGGEAIVNNLLFENNGVNIVLDDFSKINN